MILHNFMEKYNLSVSEAAGILACTSAQVRRYRAFERSPEIKSARKAGPSCISIINLINENENLIEAAKTKKSRLTSTQMRALMEELGLTSYSFSKETGIPKSTVCNWLNGTFQPSFQVSRYLFLRGLSPPNGPHLNHCN